MPADSRYFVREDVRAIFDAELYRLLTNLTEASGNVLSNGEGEEEFLEAADQVVEHWLFGDKGGRLKAEETSDAPAA